MISDAATKPADHVSQAAQRRVALQSLKDYEMNRRHQDLLTTLLEKAYLNGVAYISWNELYLWYNITRLGAVTRRDLEDRWEDISQGKVGRLVRIDREEGMFLFGEQAARPMIAESDEARAA